MPETYRNINQLLKPLEMHLKQKMYLKQNSCTIWFGFHHDKIGQLMVYVNSTSILDMPNLEYAIHCLLNTKYFSISPFSSAKQFHIENSYFGCKSLEEVLIMKDLTVKTEQ